MAYSYTQLAGNGSNTNFNFSFGYLSRSHISVKVDGVAVAFTFLTDFSVQVVPAPAADTVVEVRRTTPLDQPAVVWTDGSTLTEQDMNLDSRFNLYIAQEARDLADVSLQLDSEGAWDGRGRTTKNFADPTGPTSLVTRKYFEDTYTPILDAKVAAAAASASASASSAAQSQGYAAAADNSADLAAELLALFRGQYLGAKDEAPTVDGNGQPLTVGDLYFDNTLRQMRVYTSTGWKNATSTIEDTLSQPVAPIVATAGQTVVNIPGGYDAPFIMVFVNGVKVDAPVVDISSGTNVVFSEPLSAGDEVSYIAFGAFTVANINAADVRFQNGAAGINQSVHNKLAQSVNLADFTGFDPTGATPSDAAFAAAFAALPEAGGVVVIPVGSRISITTPLVVTKPVLLRAAVRGDVSTNTNGSSGSKPCIIWNGAAGDNMFTIKPPVAGEVIWGGGSVNIEWDGNTLAASAVHLDNTKHAKFDGKVRNVRFAGVVVDSFSGSTGNFSQLNSVDLEFIWGAVAECQNAHGVVLGGNGSNVPSTQQQLGVITGLVYNGNLVHIVETDNSYVEFINGAIQAPGTGLALLVGASGAQPSNHTVVNHIAGPMRVELNVKGVKVHHYVSEGGGITGTGEWNGDLFDYVNGRPFTSHKYKLREWISISSGEFVAGPNTSIVETASCWAANALPNSGSPRLGCTIPPDYDLANGVIETVELWYTTNGTAGGNLRMQFILSTPPENDSPTVITPQHNFTVTIPQAPQYTVKKFSYPILPNVAYTKGDMILAAVQRLASDAADTATDEVIILGMRLGYKSDGPDSGGSGSYNIPAWD